ncbi:NEDD4-binding protein 2-like 2 [Anguilla anguilla]|uniref:NEDD4-binding protein 2-like 2 n=1 Tax=Anguilla anguilla TaxID=7936 RepID=UPI0015AECAD3|nr:NEDD4-binding protein 2-like 2 [Anguilla anguilla]
MMLRSDASKSSSGKEDGDISKHSPNKRGSSALVSDQRIARGYGSGYGINGNLLGYRTQGRSDTAGNVDVAPPADGVNGEKQIFRDGTLKDRRVVIKQLGISSTDFIGPLCRPQKPKSKAELKSKAKPKPKAKPRPKANFENELSEFYKELEELEPADCVDGSADERADESNSGAWAARNPPPCGEMRFPKDRDSRWPHASRYEPDDYWQPKRHRPNFQQGPDWQGPDPPFHSDQWQHSQAFRGPHWPPHHNFNRSGYYRPAGPPPPPHPPPGFGPRRSTYYDSPEGESQWEPPQFPQGPRCPPFLGFGGYDAPQDRGPPAYPPDGFDGRREDGGNGFSSYGETAWPQPCMDSDWRQHHRPEPGPGPEPEPDPDPDPQQQWHQQPHADCDYRPAPLLLLILMRGLPGSGKSTLAKKLLSSGPNGLVLSTDDYFVDNGYAYNASLIGDAHDWNQNRAREAMDDGRSPVIIDNTNIQAWEMKPYVKMAIERRYTIDFREPDTSWKFDPFELEKRNKHGVPSNKIAQMRDRFELPMSVDIVLTSRDPPHKSASPRPPSQCPPAQCPPSQCPPSQCPLR